MSESRTNLGHAVAEHVQDIRFGFQMEPISTEQDLIEYLKSWVEHLERMAAQHKGPTSP